jgi:hypothetical protein
VSGLRAATGAVIVGPGRRRQAEELGFEPQAAVLWWCRADLERRPGNRGGIGFAAAGGAPGSIAWISDDAVPAARTQSCGTRGAIAGLDDDGAWRAEVEFGRRSLGFRTDPIPGAWLVRYLAFGGSELKAQTAWFPMPAEPQDQRVDLAFQPDLILFASAAVPVPGEPVRGLSISFGAASAPDRQGSVAVASPDGAPPGSAAGAQRTDAAIVSIRDRSGLGGLGSVSSMDAGGLAVCWHEAAGSSCQVSCLAIAGVRSEVGAAPARQRAGARRTGGVGFRPSALLCLSWGLAAAPVVRDIARLSLGAACGSEQQGAVAWDERDTPAELTATHSSSSAEDVLLVPNTQTGELHAAAALSSFGFGGFTLRWSQADGMGRQILYVALGGERGSWLAVLERAAILTAKTLRRRAARIRARRARSRYPRSASG